MNIYVDYDDCLCETARSFSQLVYEMFHIDVPYEKMRFFNLQQAFDLNDQQYEQLLQRGHEPEILLGYEETPGAAETLNAWADQGHHVSIITGRPASSYEPSRIWLDEHGFQNIELFCLNKYGRDSFYQSGGFNLELEEYYKMQFDFAIEDSPSAFRFFDHLPNLNVLVFDRPWNREAEFRTEHYVRCQDWKRIREIVG